MYAMANLKPSQREQIERFEGETGLTVLALTEVRVKPDQISAEKLQKLQALEKELGLVLVAVRAEEKV